MKTNLSQLTRFYHSRSHSGKHLAMALGALFLLASTFLVSAGMRPAQHATGSEASLKNKKLSSVNSYYYTGRADQTVKKDTLQQARFLSAIAPHLWSSLVMPHHARMDLDRVAGKHDVPSNTGNNFKESDYLNVLAYQSVEISVISNGKVLSSKSPDDQLTEEQRTYLNAADAGTNIHIQVQFRYKQALSENPADLLVSGSLAVTIVPEKEAQYPGGLVKLNEYFYKQTVSPVPEITAYFKRDLAIIGFTVNEQGHAGNAKLVKTSGDSRMDAQLLKAVGTMQEWKPAENAQGVKIEQTFFIPFNAEGC